MNVANWRRSLRLVYRKARHRNDMVSAVALVSARLDEALISNPDTIMRLGMIYRPSTGSLTLICGDTP